MLDLKSMSSTYSARQKHYRNWVSSLSNILATTLLKMSGFSLTIIQVVIPIALGLTAQANKIVNS